MITEQRMTIRLNELPTDRWATVSEVDVPADLKDREIVLRLVELGFVPDERVCVVAMGIPGREPMAVRVGGSTFALRRHEASFVRVSPM
ncbi:MAG: FeoA family protein [Flavobacteriales bacterium]|nr:ferrous iron transport protein A [Flavobacteriales bacterium]